MVLLQCLTMSDFLRRSERRVCDGVSELVQVQIQPNKPRNDNDSRCFPHGEDV
jgi:hypothetical protein